MAEVKRQHTLPAMYDNRHEAARAIERLVEAGIDHAEVHILPGDAASAYTRPSGQTSYDHGRDEGGFWGALDPLGLPHDDRFSYAEGMSRGSVVLSVRVDEADLERASEILERHGSVHMDEREAQWRREGWTGYRAMGAGGTAAAQARPPTGGVAREEVIPITEEELRVGKRQVVRGRVRVRAYVVEVPVEVPVRLRHERVQVERHPVGRRLTPEEEAALLKDRDLELEELDEEPVVEKVPVIKEELVIRRETGERVETVSDRVRRTQVELEDERPGSRSGKSAS